MSTNDSKNKRMREEKECCTQPKQEEGRALQHNTRKKQEKNHPANEEFVDQANTEGASASIIL